MRRDEFLFLFKDLLDQAVMVAAHPCLHFGISQPEIISLEF